MQVEAVALKQEIQVSTDDIVCGIKKVELRAPVEEMRKQEAGGAIQLMDVRRAARTCLAAQRVPAVFITLRRSCTAPGPAAPDIHSAMEFWKVPALGIVRVDPQLTISLHLLGLSI